MGAPVPKAMSDDSGGSAAGGEGGQASPAGRPATLKPGSVLQSRYRIQDVIGVGGMSTVYRARDLRFAGVERLCAVKEMFSVVEEPRLRQMRLTNFQREAAMLATLNHAAIPSIYDCFDLHGTPYLVLELVRGQDLESLLARRGEAFPQETVVTWALELSEVLVYLHRQTPEPVIFRDLKPSNIMLRQDGRLTLIDFGIARSFAPSQKGTMIGTEGYAPPEQYRGISDERGDIYALGATLHHLVTASDPRNETPFTFAQRPPRRLNPALTPEFAHLILTSVAYSASDRFASMAEVRQGLESIRDQRPAPSGASTISADKRSRSSESRLLVVTESEAAPAAAAATARVDWVMTTGDEIRGSASYAGGAVYVGSYDGHLYAIDETDGGVRWRHRARRGIVSRPLVTDDLVIFGAEDNTIVAVSRQQGRQAWSFRTTMPVRSSATADEHGVMIGSDDGYLYRLDKARGTMIWRYKTWGPMRATPLVLADGATVVGSDDGYVYSIDRDSGRLRWRRQIGPAIVASAAIADRVLIVAGIDGVVRGLASEGGNPLWSQATGKSIIASPVVVDQTCYIGSADGSLYALAVASGEISWRSPLCRQITSTVAIDGESLYVGGTDGALYCLDRATGQVRWRHELGGAIVARPLVTPDHIIVGGLDGKLYALHRGE